MNDCTLKIIIMFVCLFVTLVGLYLAFIREKKNIATGTSDTQTGSGNMKEGSINFQFAIGLALIIIGLPALYFFAKLPGCEEQKINPGMDSNLNVEKADSISTQKKYQSNAQTKKNDTLISAQTRNRKKNMNQKILNIQAQTNSGNSHVVNGNNYGVNGDVNLDIPKPSYRMRVDTFNFRFNDYYHSLLRFEINSKIAIPFLQININGFFSKFDLYPINGGILSSESGKNNLGTYFKIFTPQNGIYEISLNSKKVQLMDSIILFDSFGENIIYNLSSVRLTH